MAGEHVSDDALAYFIERGDPTLAITHPELLTMVYAWLTELQQRRAAESARAGGADLDDRIGRAAHEAWTVWIMGQGYANHAWSRDSVSGDVRFVCCGEDYDKHHPDMVPWDDLPEGKRGKYIEMARAGYLIGREEHGD